MPKIKIPSAKGVDQAVTRKMLWLVRDQLKSEIRAQGSKFDAKFVEVRTEMNSGFSEMKIEMAQMRADIAEMKSENSRALVLLEEQNANNRIVLEGIQALWQRQDRIERKIGQ